jgi:hypothetical protein
MSNIAAGLPSEKVGMNEIPLLVIVAAPPIWSGTFVMSVFWENAIKERFRKNRKSDAFIKRYLVTGLIVRYFKVVKKNDFKGKL